jgi:hypothetical protein
MNITVLAALVLVAGTGANGAGRKVPTFKDAAETVQICSDHTADNGMNLRARNITTLMFAGIGVAIEWRHNDSCPAGALRISYTTSTPEHLMPHALAYALPYEGTHIVIFYDRVQAAIEPGGVPILLAHVLAHEVTHVLEGIPRHSGEGVMKAQWTRDDYSRMCWKPLKFAAVDVAMIHSGLQQRDARRNAERSGIGALAGGE